MANSLVDAHGRKAYAAGQANLQQFLFVALNAAGALVLPAANGMAIGVLDDAPPLILGTLQPNGEYAGGYVVPSNPSVTGPGPFYGIVFSGAQKVYAGAALPPMTAVATNAAGQAVPATGTGTFILGVTLEGCNAGDLVLTNIRTVGAIHP